MLNRFRSVARRSLAPMFMAALGASGLALASTGSALADSQLTVSANSFLDRTNLEGVDNSFGQLATFTDPAACTGGVCNPAAAYQVSIRWGDLGGSSCGMTAANPCSDSSNPSVKLVDASTGTYAVGAGHLYHDEFNCPGNPSPCGYPFHVDVTDTLDAHHGAGDGQIAIVDQPLNGASGASLNLTATQPFAGKLGSFHDNNALARNADQGATGPEFNVSVNWGDGTAATKGAATVGSCTPPSGATPGGCTVNVYGTHTYASSGNYPINITVNDGRDQRNVTIQAQATVVEASVQTTSASSTSSSDTSSAATSSSSTSQPSVAVTTTTTTSQSTSTTVETTTSSTSESFSNLPAFSVDGGSGFNAASGAALPDTAAPQHPLPIFGIGFLGLTLGLAIGGLVGRRLAHARA